MKSVVLSVPLFSALAHGLFGGTRTTTYTWTNLGQTVTAIQGGEYGNSVLIGEGSSSIYASYNEITTYLSKTITIGTNGSVALVSTPISGYGQSSSTPASVSAPVGTGSSSVPAVAPTSSSSQYIAPASSSSVYVAPASSSSTVAYVPTSSSSVPVEPVYTSSSSIVPYISPPSSSSVPIGTGSYSASYSSSSGSASGSNSSVVLSQPASTPASSSSTPILGTGSSSVPIGTGHSASSSSPPVDSGSLSSSYSLSQSSVAAGNSSVVASTSSHTLSASISGSHSASASGSTSISGSASSGASASLDSSNSGSASGSASASGSQSPSGSSSQAPSGSASSSAVAGGYPVVITVATTINGQSTDVPVISGGSITAPIAITPTTTYAPTEVTSSKEVVESQLSSIFPLIQGWLDDTESDPEPVIQNLDDIESDVTNLINGLEQGSNDDDNGGGCTSGLFSLFTCIIGDVTAIKGGITGTITGPVISSIQGALTDLTTLTSSIQDVKDNNDNNDDDDDDDDDDDQSSSQSSGSTSASSSSASCSASAVAHTQVTCSPSPISQSGTIASYTQICTTGIETITKCSASYSASTTTLSASTSSGTPLSMSGDFEGEQGGDISEQIYSEIDGVMGCITGFQLPIPTACPGMGGGSDSNTTSGSASASASASGSSSITGSSSGVTGSVSASASAGSSSSLSVPRSTSASSSGNSASVSSSVPPSSSSPTSTYSPTTAPPITSCALVTQPLTTIYSQEYPETIACSCNDGWTAGIGTLVDDDGVTSYTCQVGTTTTMAVSTTSPPPPPPPPYTTGTCNVHVFEASLGGDLDLYVQLNLTDGGNNLLSSTEYEAEWGDTMTLSGDDTKLPWDVVVDFTKSTQVSKKLRKRGASKRELFDVLRRDPEYAERMQRNPELAEILKRDPLACIAKRSPVPQCGGPVSTPDPYEKWEVTLSAGDSHWSTEDTDDTKMPHCNVGGWDNGDFGDFLDEVFSLGTEQQVPTRQMDCYFAC